MQTVGLEGVGPVSDSGGMDRLEHMTGELRFPDIIITNTPRTLLFSGELDDRRRPPSFAVAQVVGEHIFRIRVT